MESSSARLSFLKVEESRGQKANYYKDKPKSRKRNLIKIQITKNSKNKLNIWTIIDGKMIFKINFVN